jgi:pimeloyl-ACP methyl ester carboxylesterase
MQGHISMQNDMTTTTHTRDHPRLACVVLLADAHDQRPPIVLIHGSANSAAVWRLWQRELATRGWSSYALDLRGHGQSPAVDLAQVSMADYASDVCILVRQLRQPPVLLGWSMGGLVALMVAAAGGIAACVALAPSTPVRQEDPSVTVRTGVMTAKVYGITSTDPAEQPAMPDLSLEERVIALASLSPESLRARDERQRGIVIEALPCPLLIVTGTLDQLWPSTRYNALWFPATRLQIEGASHWGLVLNGRALVAYLPQVVGWLEQVLALG